MEKTTQYTDTIRKCYKEILNREPDDVGFNHFLDLMKNGKIDENQLRETMKTSEEYKGIQWKKQFLDRYDMSKNFFGKCWVGLDYAWYLHIFERMPIIHSDFFGYLRSKKDIKSVLEVGCGAGVLPIRFKELFSDKKYVGCDISESAIAHAKANSDFDFICGDFLKMDITGKYDLVFSLSTVDNVYDVDLFLSKIVQLCKKYAYIVSYLGFNPDLEDHKMKYLESDGYYENKISIKKVKKLLLDNGLKEYEFTIKPQETGDKEFKTGTIIQIERKS